MPTIKKKVWTKETPTSSPELKTLNPETADITKVVQLSTEDPEFLRIIPYGSQVNTQSLIETIADLVSNDIALNDQVVATNEIISEGIFDISRSILTDDEETELSGYETELGGGGSLDPDETDRYYYLLKKKYGYKFDVEVDIDNSGPTQEITVEVGPGKFKVDEETESGVYFIPDISEFDVDPIATNGTYRLDIVEAVFREDDAETPYLKYTYGVEEIDPSPGHVFNDRVLETDYATFPLWSVLFKDVAGTTELVRITQIPPFVGLKALLELENMELHELETDGGLTYHSVHHYKDIPLRNYTGEMLTADYGEGTVVVEVDYVNGSPYYNIEDQNPVLTGPFEQYVPASIESLPANFENIKKGSVHTFPMILADSYNDYLSIYTIDFTQFTIAIKKYSGVDPEDREGIELHVYTADPYVTENNRKEFEVITANYDLSSGDINGSPSLPLNSVAFQIDQDVSELTKLYVSHDNIQNTATPVAGDFVLVTYGKGKFQVAELLATHSKDGTAEDVLVTRPFKIYLDDNGSASGPPKVAIFKSSTERLVGNEIKDEFGAYTSWYNSLSSSDQTEVDAAYPFSDHTGVTKLPWSSGDSRADIASSYDALSYPDILTDFRRVDFPAKVELELNKWYFVKSQLFQKTEPGDTYYDPGKAKILYQDSANASVQDYDAISIWHYTTYVKNFGKYTNLHTFPDGTTARIVKITDKYGDIQDSYNFRIFDGKPAYWTLTAKNLDNETMTEPPAMVGSVGTVYFDIIRGKMIFNNDEIPEELKITCVIDNVLHGGSDTENLMHIESNTERITLAAKLASMSTDIEELTLSASASRVMKYLGPHSKILKNDTQQYNLLNNDLSGLGSIIYGCHDDASPLESEIMEQRYPISRLLIDASDEWSYDYATGQETQNIYEDTSPNLISLLANLSIPTTKNTLAIDEEETKYVFNMSSPAHLYGDTDVKRVGFRLSDRYADIARDLGLSGSANEWEDGIYLDIHDDDNNSLISSAEGVEYDTGKFALFIPQQRVIDIYEEYNRLGKAAPRSGYTDIQLQTNVDSDEAVTGLTIGKNYWFTINGTDYSISLTTGIETYEELIELMNTELELDNLECSFQYEIFAGGVLAAKNPAIRVRNITDPPGLGNDCVVSSSSPGATGDPNLDLLASMGDFVSLDDTYEIGTDNYTTAEDAQDRMWIYFEFNDKLNLPDSNIDNPYHMHLFVKYRTATTTQPVIFQVDEGKYTVPGGSSRYDYAVKLYHRPLKYSGGGSVYVGGYGVNDEIPVIIDLDENKVVPIRDGGGTVQAFTGDLAVGTDTVTNIPDTSTLEAGERIWGYGIDFETTIVSVDSATQITISNNALQNVTGGTLYNGAAEDRIDWSLTPGDDRYNVTPDNHSLDVMPADLDTDIKWDEWKYNDYVGIDVRNGRIKLPDSMYYPGTVYDWDTDLLFGEFTMRWPFSALHNKSFGDSDDENVSNYDRRFPYIKTRDEYVEFLDDRWERARVGMRSIAIDWMTGKDYKVDDIVSVDFRLYKCKTDHTSDTTAFINDIAYWTSISGGGGTIFDVNTAPYDVDDIAYEGKLYYDFLPGDVIRYKKDTEPNYGNPTFGWLRAIADSSPNIGHGMVLDVADSQNFRVITAGYMLGIVGNETGGTYTPYFTDDNTQTFTCDLDGTATITNVTGIDWSEVQTGTRALILNGEFFQNRIPENAYIVSFNQGAQTITMSEAALETETGVTLETVNPRPLKPNTWYYLSNKVPGGITSEKPPIAQTVLYTLEATNPAYDPLVDQYDGWVTDCIIDVDDMDVASVAKIETFDINVQTDTIQITNNPIGYDYVDISINGILQHEGYTISDKVIKFDEDLLVGQHVRVAYNSVLASPPGALILTDVITAADQSGPGSGQTIFTFNNLSYGPLSSEYCTITIDGAVQDDTAFSVSGKTITFNQHVYDGAEVRIKVFHNMNITAPATGSIVDNMFGDIEMYRNINIINEHLVAADDRRFSVGPVQIADGQTVTLWPFSVWAIL